MGKQGTGRRKPNEGLAVEDGGGLVLRSHGGPPATGHRVFGGKCWIHFLNRNMSTAKGSPLGSATPDPLLGCSVKWAHLSSSSPRHNLGTKAQGSDQDPWLKSHAESKVSPHCVDG